MTTTTLLHSTSVFKVRTAGTGNEPAATENLPTNNTNTETMLLSRSETRRRGGGMGARERVRQTHSFVHLGFKQCKGKINNKKRGYFQDDSSTARPFYEQMGKKRKIEGRKWATADHPPSLPK